MDINGAVGLLQLVANIGEDPLMAARILEGYGMQKNVAMLSKLSAFQILLDDVYEICRPSFEDYANRKDLIRIFNEIAKEMYGNNAECPVLENFGSFLMDMFNARSDLDLSINFRDQLFEADRLVKIKTLRKFAKKFYALRKKGHITTVELILSARVPVLKVTDSGSGIDCDLSVGNRDGIAKSHIIHMITAIDERFQKLCFMVKAWAKANDINSSKDGTLNSLSLILLVAFHLQTRDIPILPPFSAILKDGTDLAAVKKLTISFVSYGERNKESLAELFVSLLVKLESVESLWSKRLCASPYEGSWIYKSWKATGCISIEDFTDRSQNTARAVKSTQFNKIYSCIRSSVEQIRSFTEGVINAHKLKILLFGKVSHQMKKVITNVNHTEISKPVPQNPTQRQKKRLTQGSPGEGQRPGKQGKNCHNPCSSETPSNSRIGGVKMTAESARKSVTVTSKGPAGGQRPGKQGKHCHNPCSSKDPTPTGTGRVKKKLGTGIKTGPVTSVTPAEGQKPEKHGKHCHTPGSLEAPTPSRTGSVKKKSGTGKKAGPVTSVSPAEGQSPGKQGKHSLNPCNSKVPTPSRTGRAKKKSGNERKTGPMTSDTLTSTSFQGLDKSQETLSRISCQPILDLPIQGSGGFRPERADIATLNIATQRSHVDTLSHAPPNLLEGQRFPYSNPYIHGFRPDRTHVEASRHTALNYTLHQPISSSGYGGFIPDRTRVEASRHSAPNYTPHQPISSSGYGAFRPDMTGVEASRHTAPYHAPRPPISSSGYGGSKPELTYFETMKYTAPSFPQVQPLSHSNHLHIQGYGGSIKSGRTHVETLGQGSDFVAGPPIPVTNPSSQAYRRLIPDRVQGETPSYTASERRPLPFPNLPSYRPETTNYATSSQPPLHYTLSSTPSSAMPPHQPYNSAIPCTNPSGPQRSHYPHQSFPHVPSQLSVNLRPYQS